MPDLRLEIILIALVVIGAILLILSYVWVFLIQQSPLRLIVMVLRSALDRDRLVDPNAPINVPTAPLRSDAMELRGDLLKQSSLLPQTPVMAQTVGAPPLHTVPRAPLAETEIHAPDETTSDNGWPVKLDHDQRQARRPFLNIHLKSEQDPNALPNLNSDQPQP